MAAGVKSLFRLHADIICKSLDLEREDIERVQFLHEFDRAVQCVAWDYADEVAYYRDVSTTQSISKIRVPFLAINAMDDPIAVSEAIPWKEFFESSFGVLCTTSTGGHIGWFQADGKRWFPKVAYNVFQRMEGSDGTSESS
jgi:uncharacterized protein